MIGVKKEKNFTVIILPDDYQIEIGNCDNEITLADVSVNKQHATIQYNT